MQISVKEYHFEQVLIYKYLFMYLCIYVCIYLFMYLCIYYLCIMNLCTYLCVNYYLFINYSLIYELHITTFSRLDASVQNFNTKREGIQ